MLGLILLAVGICGFGLAAYWDLKTTEFPDWLPYSIIILSLGIRAVFAFIYADAWILLSSLLIGSAFLGFGMLMYYARQWGDGDAWLIGALGFLFPDATGFAVNTFFPFPIAMLFNFFFVSFFYMVAYSVALGLMNRSVARKFFGSLRGNLKGMAMIIAVFTALCAGLVIALVSAFPMQPMMLVYMMLFPFVLAAILLFARYGKFVENNLFRRQISAKKVRVGDVPVGNRWRGLTEQEVKKIKNKGGKIWIKEGVRFAPAFIITLLVTMLYGGIFAAFV